jgi:hypothetical protein
MGRVRVSRLMSKLYAVVSVCAVLCACAARPVGGPASSSARPSVRPHTAAPPAERPSPVSQSRSATGCRPGATTNGFALSIAAGAIGSATPVKAAQYFVRHGGQPGYGTPTTRWHVVASTDDAAELRSDHANVHVSRMPNRSWIVDSGTACV